MANIILGSRNGAEEKCIQRKGSFDDDEDKVVHDFLREDNGGGKSAGSMLRQRREQRDFDERAGGT